jgi:hypothetical protein
VVYFWAPITPPPSFYAKPKKACCNCCSCSCHPAQIQRGRTSSRFPWLQKLFFWQKKPVDDAASVSSSGSSTIAD